MRREVSRWGLPPPRREALLTGLGQAVWRALRRGLVRTTAQVRRLLHALLHRLREDAWEGLSLDLRRCCAFGTWAVVGGLREIGLSPLGGPASTSFR